MVIVKDTLKAAMDAEKEELGQEFPALFAADGDGDRCYLLTVVGDDRRQAALTDCLQALAAVGPGHVLLFAEAVTLFRQGSPTAAALSALMDAGWAVTAAAESVALYDMADAVPAAITVTTPAFLAILERTRKIITL